MPTSPTNHPEIKRICRQLVKQGWRVERRSGGHLKLTAPTGGFYFCSATPSDRRAVKNLTHDLRQRGADLP